MKRLITIFTIVLFISSIASAATEPQKQTAINNGLLWLANQQQLDGRWEYGDDGSDVAATGAALLAFAEEGSTLSGGPYQAQVTLGLNYLFSKATTYAIGPQPAGNPDQALPNGVGVKFPTPGGNTGRDIYATGLAVPGIIRGVGAANMNLPVAGGLPGYTYLQAIQDVVDYLAYAQNDIGMGVGGNARGGWRYFANYGSSDNSTSQWPIVALDYAKAWGVTAPGFVETELDFWANYIQNPDGGSDYPDGKGWGSNVSRTGALLLQQEYTHWNVEPANVAKVNAALGYIDSQWPSPAAGWNGNFGHPYAMWAAYKGLEVTIGLADTTTITNLHPQGGAPLDPGDVWNWWEDYCEWLVSNQNADGSWNDYSGTGYWTGPLATAWSVNILAATIIPVIPAPGAIILGSIGVGLVGWLRRRRTL